MPLAPDSRTIRALLDEQAARYACRPAVRFGDQCLTYEALRAEVIAFAAGLQSRGIGHGDHVGILMGNRTEWVVATLAIQWLGAVTVGVNTWSSQDELVFNLAHARVKLLVAARSLGRRDFASTIGRIREAGLVPELVQVDWVEPQFTPAVALFGLDAAHSVPMRQRQEPQATDVGTLFYTSGSTAQPKAILLAQGDAIANAWHIGERMRVTCDDRFWLAVSMFWTFGGINALLNALTHGACCVLQESFDAGEALRLIATERCTVYYGIPNMVSAMLDHPARTDYDLSSLRTGLTIGTPEQMGQAVALGITQICQVYGMSETYGNCCVTDADDPFEIRATTGGPALPGFTLKVCDPTTGARLPQGTTGEIRVLGRCMLGYYREPEKTAEAFDEEGYLKTGDLGLLDEAGRVHFRGRLKEMIKTGGINVAPSEIEHVLLQHPDICEAYVVGLPDTRVDELIAAAIVLHRDATMSEAQLRAYCQQRLAAYKVPKVFAFVGLQDLPLTSTGKIQKNRIGAAVFAARAPG